MSTSRLLSMISGALLVLGLVVIVLYAASTPGRPVRYISVGILAAIAALVTGCLLGFLFGIPKVVSSGELRLRGSQPSQATTTQTPDTTVTTSLIQPGAMVAAADPPSGGPGRPVDAGPPPGQVPPPGQPPPPAQGALPGQAPPPGQPPPGQPPPGQPPPGQLPPGGQAPGPHGPGPSSPFEPSTNLSEVSDWLTKLLLGAGLVGLTHLGEPAGRLIDTVALGLARPVAGGGPDSTAQVMGGALLITYLVLGFLDGYVVTTLWYGSKVRQA